MRFSKYPNRTREKPLFYRCQLCEHEWKTLDEFLDDADVVLEGVHAKPIEPNEGIMYFTHSANGCGTTFGKRTGEFRELIGRTPFTVDLSETKYCPGQCSRPKDFSNCGKPCSSLWVRQVIVAICTRRE